MQNKTDYFDNGKSRLYVGNCIDVMKRLIDEGVQIDSIVTDPPYHLTSIVKRFGKEGSSPAQFGTDGAYARASKGFMGKEWDGGDVAFRAETWVLALELLKPGGHLLAFSGSRTYHRMACGIEDAGFEIRDQIMWLYGSGFPKSHNQKGDWQGWGSALKPAHEPIVVARKPLAGTIAENVLQYGTGALNIDGCRVGDEGGTKGIPNGGGNKSNDVFGVYGACDTTSIDGLGRWPANVIHDGSPETTDPFPADGGASAARFFYCAKASKEDRDEGLGGFELHEPIHGKGNDDGGLTVSNSKAPRANTHPTVKPTDLMRYLCRLVTPPGGLVLDPFMGSGSTGKAAMLEGFRFVGIDMTPEYVEIARARIQHAHDQKHDIESLIRSESAHTDQMSLFD